MIAMEADPELTPEGPNYLVQAIFAEDWDTVAEQCASSDCTAEAKTWSKIPYFVDCRGETDVLPIHVATAMCSPCHIVDSILQAYPEAARAKESGYGRLPIHLACRSGADEDVVRSLLRKYPESSQVSDRMGRLPLHYAVRHSSEEVVKLLLRANPLASKVYDKPGWLPLHTACQIVSPIGVVKMLLEAYPSSISATTHTGITPKSIVEVSRKPNKLQILELFERSDPSVEKESHEEGRTTPPSFDRPALDGKARSSPCILSGQPLSPCCVGQANTMWETAFHET